MFGETSGTHNKFLGGLGEKKARKYLKKKGFKIIDANFVSKFGEVDLIGLYEDFLVFIEVKTRHTQRYGTPCEAVDEKKQERYRQSAQFYIFYKKLYTYQPRFDVVEVYKDRINHIEGAF